MAVAQTNASSTPLPVRTYVDGNGVDLFTGLTILRSPVLRAGASQRLQYYQIRAGGVGYKDNLQGAVTINGSIATVSIGELTETFAINGSQYTPTELRGSTLTGGGTAYVYKTADGTTFNFSRDPTCSNCRTVYTQWGDAPVIHSIIYADGSRLDFGWQSTQTQVGQTPAGPVLVDVRRVTTILSNDGYSLNFKFLKEPSSRDFTGSTIVTKATAFNASQDGCSGGGNCTTSSARPALTIDGTNYTDSLGRTTVVGTSSIRRPGSSVDNVTYSFDGNSRVTQVVADGVTTVYGYSDAGDIRTVTVARAGAPARVLTFNILKRSMKSDTDPTGRKTSYEYDDSARLLKTIAPENNSIASGYDARGNATSTTVTGKTGGTLATSATFPCSVAAACNEPMSVTDARGNVTNFDYDPNSGLVSKVTQPAVNGVRPEKRLGYSQVGGVWRLTSTSECRTAGPGACLNGADEVKTSIAYTGSTALPASVSVGAGDNTLTATTGMTYDAMGRLLTVDGPLPGADDTTRFYYDVEGQVLGNIGPDPDGGGALKRRTVRNTYNPAGQVTLVEIGTATDQGDSALANMIVLQSSTTTYDANNRKVASSVTSGGTTFAYSQMNYDGRGRINCVVTRMNPSAFGQTGDACALGTQGASGPDRVTQTGYDDANRILSVTTAVGTADASLEKTSYTRNGLVETMTDAANNRTTNFYDQYDRLIDRQFPVAPKGSDVSNGYDHEEYGYDAAGNIVANRKRDGQLLTFTYDALNRRSYDDNPNTNVAEVDATYSYDNLGNLLRASDQNGWYSAYEYDALGRATRQYSNVSSNRLAYDLGGRLIQQTWADNFYSTYEYLVTGEVKKVRENGGFELANFEYDNLGRRTSLTRGNGTVTSYGFDAVSRLTSLSQDLAGTAQDLSLTFAYNPTGQITSRTASNDAYAYTGAYNVDRAYAINGLNQYTQSGPVGLGYDGRGNLTNAGNGVTYTYNTRNQLFTNNAGQLFYRNPIGLLNHIIANNTVTNLDYVGANLAGEFDGNTGGLLRRYVYGPGVDEPLVWYEGGDRRYLHADERGSVIAVSNNAGNATAINTYDEYGIPGASNQGRFQYTGQKWIPELGLYDYKARLYSPTLGRFLQTDPIGYGDGMNWYNYVGSDPMNFSDPFGLASCYNITSTTGGLPTIVDTSGAIAVTATKSKTTTVCLPEGVGINSGAGYTVTPSPNPQSGGQTQQNAFRIDKGTPPNSKQCTAGGVSFQAPNNFNPPAIGRAGAAGGLSGTNAAVGHYGTYDFQRVQTSFGTTFFRQYTPVANLAVGFYLAGAGYSRTSANLISDGFASVFSSNGASSEQNQFRNLAYDVAEGKAKIVCYPK